MLMAETTAELDVPFSPEEQHDPAYLKYLEDSAYEHWQERFPTERERKLYPFCKDCLEGHDPSKITCDEVAGMIWADREIGLGM
jgi:hypothetical protein